MTPVTARHYRGFTLVELMVALVAGLIVSGAALAFFFSSMRSNGEYVQSTRLTQELRNSMDLITRDLRRAGYDDNVLDLLATSTASPFAKLCLTTGGSATCLKIANSVGDCIIYAYDRPGGTAGSLGAAGAWDVGEVRGLRRKQVTIPNGDSVGVIEYAANTATIKPACNDASAIYTSYPAACNGVWCPLSDASRLNITSLTFTANLAQAVGGAQLRDISVSLQGSLGRSATAGYQVGDYTRGVKSNIRIRSECYGDSTACNVAP